MGLEAMAGRPVYHLWGIKREIIH